VPQIRKVLFWYGAWRCIDNRQAKGLTGGALYWGAPGGTSSFVRR